MQRAPFQGILPLSTFPAQMLQGVFPPGLFQLHPGFPFFMQPQPQRALPIAPNPSVGAASTDLVPSGDAERANPAPQPTGSSAPQPPAPQNFGPEFWNQPRMIFIPALPQLLPAPQLALPVPPETATISLEAHREEIKKLMEEHKLNVEKLQKDFEEEKSKDKEEVEKMLRQIVQDATMEAEHLQEELEKKFKEEQKQKLHWKEKAEKEAADHETYGSLIRSATFDARKTKQDLNNTIHHLQCELAQSQNDFWNLKRECVRVKASDAARFSGEIQKCQKRITELEEEKKASTRSGGEKPPVSSPTTSRKMANWINALHIAREMRWDHRWPAPIEDCFFNVTGSQDLPQIVRGLPLPTDLHRVFPGCAYSFNDLKIIQGEQVHLGLIKFEKSPGTKRKSLEQEKQTPEKKKRADGPSGSGPETVN